MISYDWRRCPPPVEPMDPTVARDYGPLSADIGPRLFSDPPVDGSTLCEPAASPCALLGIAGLAYLLLKK